MTDRLKRFRFAAAVLGLVIGTSGRGLADVVISNLSDASGGYGQAAEQGQAFVNGTVAEVVKTIQIEATFATVPGEYLTLNARKADGTVGTQLFTFNAGSSDSSTRLVTFTPTGTATLSAGTGYFVVLHGSSGSQPYWDFAPPHSSSTSDNGSTLPPTNTWFLTVNGSTSYGTLADGANLFQVDGTAAVAGVPEPSTLGVTGLACLLGLGYAWRRHKV
jgi:hypothetical protein